MISLFVDSKLNLSHDLNPVTFAANQREICTEAWYETDIGKFVKMENIDHGVYPEIINYASAFQPNIMVGLHMTEKQHTMFLLSGYKQLRT